MIELHFQIEHGVFIIFAHGDSGLLEFDDWGKTGQVALRTITENGLIENNIDIENDEVVLKKTKEWEFGMEDKKKKRSANGGSESKSKSKHAGAVDRKFDGQSFRLIESESGSGHGHESSSNMNHCVDVSLSDSDTETIVEIP
ncbi:hypothetical protein F0562_033335 [Nyssa sinensis]|uniref:Uncharacterized protein n=1 Tax=Nyssa sinensis TaxID=561372 RepID=A0A5J5ATV8_9ASTE|nr:hypothetical protein F0562_033335 [Nyssa sinensis]